MTYLLLFYEYFKTGLFAIGGGMATLPFLYDMSARHPDWFTTAQIDRNTWSVEMLDMLMDFIRTDPRAAQYRDIDWSHEYDMAINGDPNDTQSAL